MLKARFSLSELVREHGLRSRHGGTPSPQRGEGGGEGESISRSFVTPSPHPSPRWGEGAGRIRCTGVPSIGVKRNSGRLVRGAKSASPYFTTLVVCAVAIVAARAEQRVPGLTGIDHAPDVVQARQLLMSGIEEEMQPIDVVAGGKDLPLDEVKSNAYRINIMLAAFPHLFPPQTKPGPDEYSTAAAPEIWQDFEAFYSQSDAAAKVAYDASQATAIDQFRDNAKKLRAACDGCHGKYMKVEPPPSPP
jgi:cytochrome c556